MFFPIDLYTGLAKNNDKGKEMKKIITGTVVLLTALGFSGAAVADNIVEVWNCKTGEDKTIEDVQAANSKWLAYVHANISEDVTSAVVTSIVGDATGFLFADTYPDLETWAKVKTRLDGVEEIETLFEGLSECTTNTLYNSEPTE